MNFWIAAPGRSGTTWLARLLDKSPSHTVRHEEADPRGTGIGHWEPFPLQRWKGRTNYGECHSILACYLHPQSPGPERSVPRRAILLRNPRDTITSWMNRPEPLELEYCCRAVCGIQRRLLDYACSDPQCRVVHLETLVSDLDGLQEFVRWLGITDFEPTWRDQIQSCNASPIDRFRWSDQAETIYLSLK